MQKWKKISIGVLCGAVTFTTLYYGALLSLPKVVDLNKYKESISQSIEKETGFKVACEDISFKKSLTPYLKISDSPFQTCSFPPLRLQRISQPEFRANYPLQRH